MKKLSLIAAAGVSLFSIIAHADNYLGSRAHAGYVTLGGGYEYFASKRNIDNTGMGIATLGYNLTDTWGVEALVSSFRTEFKNRVNDPRSINGNLFAVDAVYHFAAYNAVEPYLVGGPGFTRLNPNRNDATSEGNFNLGVGVKTFINKAVGFGIEARDLYTFTGGKNDVLFSAGITFMMDFC